MSMTRAYKWYAHFKNGDFSLEGLKLVRLGYRAASLTVASNYSSLAICTRSVILLFHSRVSRICVILLRRR